MTRVWRWLAAVLLALSFVLIAGAPAHADDDDTPSSWRITRFDVTATPAANGVTTVTFDFDFDFANDPGHGPYIVLVNRMAVPNDPDRWRMIDLEVESVTSGTGANTTTKTTTEGGAMLVRVGREGTRYTGVQNYKITYTATGLIEKANPQSSLDEFNWTVFSSWEVPMSNVSVTVNGPVPAQQTGCFTGSNFSQQCGEATTSGNDATWTLDRLPKNGKLQVVSGFPLGTFAAAEVRYTKRYNVGNMFPVSAATLGGAGAAGALGLAALVAVFRRTGRDRAYLGLTPGLTPAAGAEHQQGVATKTPVTVQFQPPKDATPGEVGVLIDESADNRDVTATIIDLAVRGHMKIEQPDGGSFVLHRTSGGDATRPYEKQLLSDLFLGSDTVTKEQMENSSRADVLTKTRTRLYHRVTDERQWFRGNPSTVRTVWTLLGFAAVIGAGVLSLLLSLKGWGVVGLGLLIPAIALVIAARHMPARTAEGSAVLSQTKGFELYLRTAEANQIKFEEGIDVFSRYLPYAIVFGVADRWAKVFQELADQGIYRGDTSWYVGNPLMYGMYGGMGGMMNSLTTSMSTSMSAAVASANASSAGGGSSGFSGGGGFGGSGGGGW